MQFSAADIIMKVVLRRRLEPLGEVIAILSGKGGTGKTSVCAGLSAALAAQGEKVLCVDCDIGLRNLDISLGMSESGALSFLDVCRGSYPLEQAPVHPVWPSLHFLTAPVERGAAVTAEAFSALMRRACGEYAYVFLDAPGGMDAGFELAAAAAGRILLVTGADPAAVRDAARIAQVLDQMGKERVRLVVNRVDKRMIAAMDLTVDDIMDTAGLPLLGLVPEDPAVTLAAAFGQSVLAYAPRGGASRAFRRIARRLRGIPEPVALR